MDATGILFSDLPRSGLMQSGLPALIGKRSMASVPFGCRYRLIDFSLSALANAEIRKVGIVASYGDRELMDHIGSGKDWDLALRSGGIRFLPPEGMGQAIPTRLELLKGVRWAIAADTEPLVVLCDGDLICNFDVSDILNEHRRSGADITVAVKRMYLSGNRHMTRSRILCEEDAQGNIVDLYASSATQSGEFTVCMHLYVCNRALLVQLIDEAIAHNLSGFHRNLLLRCRGRYHLRTYHYDGYYAKIGSLAEYFACSMQLAKDENVRKALFDAPKRPILTRVRNSSPTLYRHHARVRSGLIADGCEIDGEVENSILFRGVKIGRGAVVRNSILLRGCEVGPCAMLKCVVADNNARIHSSLSGVESMPFYVSEGVRL